MYKNYIVSLSVAMLISCAANEPVPESRSVKLSMHSASDNCKFLGEVTGDQGGYFTAELTSDSNLIKGARNELRNNAYNLGANYVEIESQSNTHMEEGGMYSSTITGNAYACP